MKALVLILVLALALAACGGSEKRLAAATGAVYDGSGPFRCLSAVNYDLVRVTTPVDATFDAIYLGQHCSGRIGRVEVTSQGADGIKVQNSGSVAHDVTIESGYVICTHVTPGAHQDAMQAMGGARITMQDLYLSCLGNSNWFVAQGGGYSSLPTDIVCEGCTMGPDAASPLFIADSLRSGARDSFICGHLRITDKAQDPVNVSNTQLPVTDPRCGGLSPPPPPAPAPPPPPMPPPTTTTSGLGGTP